MLLCNSVTAAINIRAYRLVNPSADHLRTCISVHVTWLPPPPPPGSKVKVHSLCVLLTSNCNVVSQSMEANMMM